MVGQSSPGESSLRNTQHHLKGRFKLPSVETKRRDKMVRVQFPHPFDHSDKFWVVFELQPAPVDSGDRRLDHNRSLRRVHRISCIVVLQHLLLVAPGGLLGVGPRVFIFRKRAAPAVGKIKDRHVKDEHGVVSACAWSKDVA